MSVVVWSHCLPDFCCYTVLWLFCWRGVRLRENFWSGKIKSLGKEGAEEGSRLKGATRIWSPGKQTSTDGSGQQAGAVYCLWGQTYPVEERNHCCFLLLPSFIRICQLLEKASLFLKLSKQGHLSLVQCHTYRGLALNQSCFSPALRWLNNHHLSSCVSHWPAKQASLRHRRAVTSTGPASRPSTGAVWWPFQTTTLLSTALTASTHPDNLVKEIFLHYQGILFFFPLALSPRFIAVSKIDFWGDYIGKIVQKGDHWQVPPLSQTEPPTCQSVYVRSRVVCGQCVWGHLSSLSPRELACLHPPACGRVTLRLTPGHSLVLPTSQEVCTGSCAGQCTGSFFRTGKKNNPALAHLHFPLCASAVWTQWAPAKDTLPSVNTYIGIDGKVKGAWHLCYLVKHPLAHLGFYTVWLVVFHLSLIIYSLCSCWQLEYWLGWYESLQRWRQRRW